ncbi:MAG TPA: hypothetical protein VGF23_23400 [Gaiellaceae bacterium]|jgi:hypothetical protein
MTTRLLPLVFVLAAVAADGAGQHRVASYLVLLAIPGAAAAALDAVAGLLEGKPNLVRSICTSLALVLLVLGSAVRYNAPRGAGVPPLALSTLAATIAAYMVPVLLWVLWQPRTRPQRVEAAVD